MSADLVKAWILRNQQDPEEIVGIGFYEVGDDVVPLRCNLDRVAQDEHRLAHGAVRRVDEAERRLRGRRGGVAIAVMVVGI